MKWFHAISAASARVLAMQTMAQGGKGTIKGQVTDVSGGVLKAPRSRLSRPHARFTTYRRKFFGGRPLARAAITLTISYVGFKTITKTVDVVAGQVASVEAKLEVSRRTNRSLSLRSVSSAEAEAVNRERTADNIVQVLPMM